MTQPTRSDRTSKIIHNTLPALPETSYATQVQRQRISPHWQPKGFERYQYQKALLDQMSTLGGDFGDQGGANPDRYQPIGPLEEDFPIR